MTRLALVIVVAAAGVTAVAATHKRPAQVQPQPASVHPLVARASRDDIRRPLALVGQSVLSGEGPQRPASVRRAAPASDQRTTLADTTMYCATGSRNAAGRWPQLGDVAVLDRSIPFGTRVRIDGNVYVVRDWIGSGSSWDIFGGNDAGCEQRALNYGRRRLSVVIER